MFENIFCQFSTAFDIIQFLGFLGITIAAGILATIRGKALKIAKKLRIGSIILIVLWILTALIMFYDAFIC